jgi:hypothetical protein
MKTCTFANCTKKHYGHGFCSAHYQKWKANGSPESKRDFPLEELFQRKTIRQGDCWIWQGSTAGKYGKVWRREDQGGTITAHRLSYIHHKGPIPEGMIVMHSCDTPRCVNPDHLSVGTWQDNMHDMAAKGRAVRRGPTGTSCAMSKLNDDLVREIRSTNEPIPALAERLGITTRTIHDVRSRKTWRHVT